MFAYIVGRRADGRQSKDEGCDVEVRRRVDRDIVVVVVGIMIGMGK